MKIVYVMPGTGGAFYCQNCLRDHCVVRSLRALGEDVIQAPLYLPLALDGAAEGADTPIFFGAVNVYLQEKSVFFRKTPRLVDGLFDTPTLLRWAAQKARSTSARGLEALTLSMLRGEAGRQAKEVDRLVRWLETNAKPDVVHLSNALLLGLAGPVRRRLGAAVVCTLQDENVWIDEMDPRFVGEVWDTLKARVPEVDAFLATSKTFGEEMALKMSIPSRKLHHVPPGLDFTEYGPADGPTREPVLGYLSRISEAQGFDIVAEAFVRLKSVPGLEKLKLRATGGYTGTDEPFLLETMKRLEKAGAAGDVEIVRDYGPRERIEFLRSLTALSVPIRTGAAFGVFLLEALACGVPVVQPRTGGFPEVLESTGGSVLFEPNEPEALAEAAAPLLRDARKARELGLEGRTKVLELYDGATIARKIVEIYNTCRI
ncbi:MAG: glycosyltransferase family 4 protein [Planctomycetota bacterium]|jgi:glycosyltransferase involved in cell wall biosynthesis